jgi:hypothetical protein
VVDFTGFSDTELFSYLRSNPGTCGRFYNDQLNRKVIPLRPKDNRWKKFYHFAAGLITFFSFRGIAIADPATPVEVSEHPRRMDRIIDSLPNNSMRIRGKVTDNAGGPLMGAEVFWNSQLRIKTDEDGRFEFTIPYPTAPGIVSVSYPDLIRGVRNYHPVMGDTEYDIALFPPCKEGHITMGAPLLMDEDFDIPLLKFDPKSNKLSEEHITTLEIVATKMRNNPGVPIELSSGGNTPVEIKNANQLLILVGNYLVDKEGISGDRIKINTVVKDLNLVRIVEIKTCVKE